MPRTEMGPAGGASRRWWRLSRKTCDGVGVGALLEFEAELALDGGVEEALPCVVDGEFELRGPVAGLGAEKRGLRRMRGGALGFEFDEEVEDGLGLRRGGWPACGAREWSSRARGSRSTS